MTEQQKTFTPVVMPQTPTEMVGEFIEYAKSIGVNVRAEKSNTPNTFEEIFGDIKEGEEQGMTNEEAIAYGEDYLKDLSSYATCKISGRHVNFVKMAIEALEKTDFADFILHWLADSYGCICDYNFSGTDAGDYLYEHDNDYCEEHCGKNTDYDCWKKFLERKFAESKG